MKPDLTSKNLQEMATKFPDAWKDFSKIYSECFSEKDRAIMSMENAWFMYAMGFYQGRIDALNSCRQQNAVLSDLTSSDKTEYVDCLIYGNDGIVVNGSECSSQEACRLLLTDRIANGQAFPEERCARVTRDWYNKGDKK